SHNTCPTLTIYNFCGSPLQHAVAAVGTGAQSVVAEDLPRACAAVGDAHAMDDAHTTHGVCFAVAVNWLID
ncbi:MAG: hypothetical protein ACRD3W_25550, partial [Terriglobales bacterium]